MGRVLVFDVWGDYAHYKKYYTTTSPLTFSIPPRTALCGLIGAILGYGKDDYILPLSKDQVSIAVGLLCPVKKVRLAENLIDTTQSPSSFHKIQERTQIRFELLKDPRFRVYFSHCDPSVQGKLRELLIDHKCIYTPCLGLSEYIAEFKYVGEYEAAEEQPERPEYIYSAIPENRILDMVFEEEREYISETMPIDMASDRSVNEYAAVMFERNAKPIKARVKSCLHLETGERIVFL